jgi:hypothetical protein
LLVERDGFERRHASFLYFSDGTVAVDSLEKEYIMGF